MDISTIVNIALWILGVIITLTIGYFGFVFSTKASIVDIRAQLKSIKDNCGTVCERIKVIEPISNRLTQLEARYEIFWKVLEPHLAGIIHSPEHLDRDGLVGKLVKGTLIQEEVGLLIPMLEESINENHDKDKRLAFALLLARVKTYIVVSGGKSC